MPDSDCILVIDQGTTSSRAIVFDHRAQPVAQAQKEFPQIYPANGWVEHDPSAIWSTSLEVSREAFREAESQGRQIIGIGITNQRETTLLWRRHDSQPVGNAIVWQDRRTADRCQAMIADGLEPEVRQRTGLLLDPYFSATKLAWLLDQSAGTRSQAARGELAFGTVDSWLIWNLTGGAVHATDATNASRTNLFNIREQCWDPWLLEQFNVPEQVLPDVRDCIASFGETDKDIFGRPIPILGLAGDQQAAAVGQCCFHPGDIKSTYGTGCFIILNTGDRLLESQHRLLSTVGLRIDGQVTYALEGSIFIAGAAVQWLRDGLQIVASAADTERLAIAAADDSEVIVVPAFTGLGAPHWRSDVRGAVFGLTRNSGPEELARATLQAVACQTRDLLEAMADDGVSPKSLRIDGGMVANNWFAQRLADLLDIAVERPRYLESTALGAALLAGRHAGLYGDGEGGWDDLAAQWQLDRRFEPAMDRATRVAALDAWDAALQRLLS